jgi:hypothetical protein
MRYTDEWILAAMQAVDSADDTAASSVSSNVTVRSNP